jgi:uncharacterized protein
VKIFVADIKDKPLELVAEEPVAGYPSLAEMEAAGECAFLAPVQIELSVSREFDHIRVRGRVATTVRLGCCRCLAEFETAIDSPFTIFYTRSNGEPMDEEVELTEEDLVSIGYSGEEIDFAAIIAEQIIMGVPLKPLCKEECLGLCSSCGADLNLAPCACERRGANLKFSALQNLRIEK